MTIGQFLRLSILPVVSCLLLTPVASAETKRVAGYVGGTQKELSATPLADGTVAKRLMFSVTVVGDDATNPFHLASQDCFATYVFSKEGKAIGGKGSCDGITVGGDVWWLSIEMRPDGVVNWVNRGGTGKFANMEASGVTHMLAQFSDGKVIGRFEGTYSVK